MLFTAIDGNTVRYYLDNNLIAEHTTSTLDDLVYPDAPMNISFINWISTNQQGSGLGNSLDNRSCTMKVDWVYHPQKTQLTTPEVEEKVANFKQNGVTYKNTMEPITSISYTGRPKTFMLEQNYPNPFNPMTQINYSFKRATEVWLGVYDIKGRLVRILVDKFQDAGSHVAIFNSEGIASGVYFYTLKVENLTTTRKMLLLK